MRVRLLVVGMCLCMGLGCGSSKSPTSGNLRFVQALADAPSLALYHNRTLISANLAYGNATAYFSINSGDSISATPAGSSSAILNTNVSITSGGNETLVLVGSGSSTKTVLLTDGGTTAVTGSGHVRAVNASSTIGSPDVYIVPAGTNITGVSPTASMLAFGTDTGYQLVPIGGSSSTSGGTYEVIMTASGTKNALLDTGPIALSGSSSNQTVIVLDGVSGGLSFTALTDQ